jgi:replicative DNA helicase
MKSKYIDTKAIMQVVGSIYLNPDLLDDERYKFNEYDFPQDFHRVMFGAIYNLHALGAKDININTIEDYLEEREQKFAIYKAYNGAEWLQKCKEIIKPATFDYYYKRVKKFTLLRVYSDYINLNFLYNPDTLDIKEKQKQEDWLDNHTVEEIANLIDDKILALRNKSVDAESSVIKAASENATELFNELKTTPNVGYPMCGKYINKIFRGARFGCVFLRSAPTNFGKSRYMIADACNFACDEIYDPVQGQWVQNGTAEPTIYIATEQSIDEIQTLAWAFVSGVPEDHILENNLTVEENQRVLKAIEIISRSPLYIKELPDFSLQDIENSIKTGMRQHDIKYVCFDYIHSSIKILSEVSGRANIKGLREDNVLFMISVRLKDLAKQYGVFILTSTQLNGDYVEEKSFDQNLLRGAKAIADKVDAGMIILPVTEKDRESLRQFCSSNGFELPTQKISIYKNRRGRYNHMFLWCNPDLGVCRLNPEFATTYLYEPIEIEDLIIQVQPKGNKWDGVF